jgi:hypothetical protein
MRKQIEYEPLSPYVIISQCFSKNFQHELKLFFKLSLFSVSVEHAALGGNIFVLKVLMVRIDQLPCEDFSRTFSQKC